jgi:Predicted flavoproteins
MMDSISSLLTLQRLFAIVCCWPREEPDPPVALKSRGGSAIALIRPCPPFFPFMWSRPGCASLPGISVADVEASVPETSLRERGPLLITHQGVSGPGILRLSAWGARILHQRDYEFALRLNWLPALTEQDVQEQLRSLRTRHPNRRVLNSPIGELPARLWEQLARVAGVIDETRWTNLSA